MICSTVMKPGAKSSALLPNHMLNELAAIYVSSEGEKLLLSDPNTHLSHISVGKTKTVNVFESTFTLLIKHISNLPSFLP